MRYFNTKGIILKKTPSGESNYFITIFSPEYGKIQAISHSSRKITSQKGSHLDCLNLCNFQIYQKQNYFYLTECKLEEAFLPIKDDLIKTQKAFIILELLIKSIQIDSPNPQLFQITIDTLNKLQNSNNILDLEKFKINLLQEAGSWPDISICLNCRNNLGNVQSIYHDYYGNFYCQECYHKENKLAEEIPFNILKLAKYLGSKNNSSITLNNHQFYQLQKFINNLLINYFQEELQSEKIIL